LLKSTVTEFRQQGTTILFSSHRMEHVEELCENIVILHRSNTVLKGNLKEIKRQFPKERVLLETEGKIDGLERINGVKNVRETAAGYEIMIHDLQAAQEILNTASAQSTVYRFQVMEPTLNDIFIRTVGEQRE